MNLTAEQMEAKKKEIRDGNDLLRTTFFPFLGKVVLTEGVANNPLKEKVLSDVREFYQFDGGNDPHYEHDFGAVEIGSEAGAYCKKRSKWYESFFSRSTITTSN